MPADGGEERPPVPRGWPDGFGRGSDLPDLVRLTTLRGIKPIDLHRLAWTEGSASGCVVAVHAGRAGTDGDRDYLSGADPDAIRRACDVLGARIVTPNDVEYPERLFDLHDPPPALYVRGVAIHDQPAMVSVVGSRHCSALGREIALDLGRNLAGVGCCVVSGAARGIDEASHLGALAAPGRTLAVLGAGIDRPYPRASRGLLIRVLDARGTLVSEYPPGVEPHARHFPARNRLIAALSIAVVVVEGVERSGSRITADHALDLGRDVFAVPGAITNPLTATPHALIRDGATLMRGLDDLFDGLGIARLLAERPPPDLSDVERRVWEALETATLPDVVGRRVAMATPEVVAVLMVLELRGLVRAVSGRYERTHRAAADPPDAPAERSGTR